uniref:Acetylcholinesterase n=1 Tax=Strongyloides papillosus TaxID=174720 RepID=A0A0N5BT05_STREA
MIYYLIRHLFQPQGPFVYQFLGVPFALPPVKKLRFMPPEPLTKDYYGKKCFKATKPAKACFSLSQLRGFPGVDDWRANPKDMSEDCLQLNMWLPLNKTGAVLVHIYDGSNKVGSPSLPVYNGSVLADVSGAIVINLNYRLGPFGFGRFKDGKVVPGNMGLLDQQMALQWIYDNVENFGGKREKITLFGHGEGASDATAHMFSKVSKEYFTRVIAISGTVLNKWSLEKTAIIEDNFKSLMKKLKCTDKDPKKQLKCMQSKKVDEIIKHARKIRNSKQPLFRNPFMAVDNDGNFFKGSVKKLLNDGNYKISTDVLLGRTTDEITMYMPEFLSSKKYGCPFNPKLGFESEKNQCKMNKKQFTNSVKFFMKQLGIKNKYFSQIVKMYKSFQGYRQKAARIFSEFMYDCDFAEFGMKVSPFVPENKDIYFYVLGKRNPSILFPKWMGVTHSSQKYYMFGHPFLYPKAYRKDAPKEQEFSMQLMKIFGDFAYNAQLSIGLPKFQTKLWPRFNKKRNLGVFIDRTLTNGEEYQKINIYNNRCEKIKSIMRK